MNSAGDDDPASPGPWKTIPSDLGDVPFYIIRFDEDGNCLSPETLEHLLHISAGKTDVVLFSHGWKNDWKDATGRYERFLEQFVAVRHQYWNPPNRDFSPVLVGVFWPSAALVAPSEQAPDIAGEGSLVAEAQVLAEAIADDQDKVRLLAIAAHPAPGGLEELARILAPVVSDCSDEFGTDANSVNAEDLLAAWTAGSLARTPAPVSGGGFIDDAPSATGPLAAPDAALWDPLEKIREALRLTTVLVMKDRAGRVGGRGVAAMLAQLSERAPLARRALVGHSYGCKVILSAICSGTAESNSVDSVLLLEPALSCYAFADDIDGHPGGYRDALHRVRQPIITTFSGNDRPLRWWFHLAVRRAVDLGEAQIAGQPPSKFAAMGGYGPAGVDADWIDMPAQGQNYPLSCPQRVIAVDGTAYIADHGAVETPQTAWALLSQLQV